MVLHARGRQPKSSPSPVVQIVGGIGFLVGLVCSVVANPVAAEAVDVVGTDDRPVQDAVVGFYPAGQPNKAVSTQTSMTAVMDQRDLRFEPHVLAIRAGTNVDFPNSDQVRHSIYSFSSTRVFEVNLYKGSEAPPILFDQPGVAVLGCSIHDSMLAYVYVLETEYFGVSDESGALLTPDLPDGRYHVRVHHPRLGENVVFEEEVTLPFSAPYRIRLSETPDPRETQTPKIEDDLDGLFGLRR